MRRMNRTRGSREASPAAIIQRKLGVIEAMKRNGEDIALVDRLGVLSSPTC